MKLKNISITKQISISLGIILLFIVIMWSAAWLVTDSLWQNTKGLYENQLPVKRAISQIEIDILTIDRKTTDLILANSDQNVPSYSQTIDALEVDVYRHFDILYNKYIGTESDIDNAYYTFVEWKNIRAQTIQMLRSGTFDDALRRSEAIGVIRNHTEKIIGQLDGIINLAKVKSENFYTGAQEQKRRIVLQLGVALGIILFLALGISIILKKAIMTPIKELLTTITALMQGQLGVRSSYKSNNEFGVLSSSFNAMAETLQNEMQNKEKSAKVSSIMFEQDELRPFCRELLKIFLNFARAQIGAIYFLNEQKTYYELFESIGLNSGARTSFAVSELEGEFGAVTATKQIQHITDIPADTKFVFSTVNGNLIPKEIMTIPIVDGETVIAVISVASIYNYNTSTVWLINDILKELTARLHSILAAQKIREFSRNLQIINEELETQTKELAMQAEELTEQNIELEMQKKQLDEASKLKSAFLSNMSHELRTPLNSVIALSSVLNRRLRGVIPDEEYSYLSVIERNGKNLLELVNDILDLARVESGKEEIQISRFKVQELICEVVDMIQPQAQEKNIALINNVSSDCPAIISDSVKLRHIIQNIIGNAVKFTVEGKVEVYVEQIDNQLHISVADTGIGIAPEHLLYVFDEFRQADESSSRRNGGTGLGLAIAMKYAQLLQGNIVVQSRLGQGSTFVIKLPLTIDLPINGFDVDNLEQHNFNRNTDNVPILNSSSISILLVEDSEPAIIQMKDIIIEQGYQIHVARNGKEALDHLESSVPDAIILDLMMPEVDGFQVLKAIRSVKRTALVPVLILTAQHITKEELSFLKGNHIFQLIQKGAISKQELLATVRNMVNKQIKPQETTVTTALGKENTKRPLVLIVEDNPDNMITAKTLLKENYDTIEAIDGLAGIEQAKKYKPDLILLDISLPVMDGFQVFRELRQDVILKHIPIVALTARAMKSDSNEIIACGFDGYVSKPIDEKLLEKVMGGLLSEK